MANGDIKIIIAVCDSSLAKCFLIFKLKILGSPYGNPDDKK